MRLSKKIVSVLMSMSLLIALLPTVVYAASGRISFTDLTTEAGVEFEIKVAVTSESDELGSIDIELNYDSDLMQFVSGDGVTNNGSTLTYSAEGSGTSTDTYITFLALKEGDASITIASQTVTNSSGTAIDMTEGNSSVTISGGTEVEATTTTTTTTTEGSGEVTVESISYTISNDFSESSIPEGYSATTYEYDGGTYNGVVGDTSGVILGYLVTADGTGEFFCYDADSYVFFPYVQVTVSDTVYIVFLTTQLSETLSDDYVETVLTVNGHEFPTWEDTTNTGFYLIHAINSSGEDSIYRYDTQDQTYQRFYPEIATEEVVEEESVLDQYMQWVMIGGGAIVAIFLILVIVLGVKLRNRNLELDDVYDELEHEKKLLAAARKGVSKKNPDKKVPLKKEPVKKVPAKKAPVKKVKDEFDELMIETKDQQYNELDDEFDKFDEFDDEFDDNYSDKFDGDFQVEIRDEMADAYERDIKDDYDDFEEKFDMPKEEKDIAPRRSIKNASARKKSEYRLDDDIDFLD